MRTTSELCRPGILARGVLALWLGAGMGAAATQPESPALAETVAAALLTYNAASSDMLPAPAPEQLRELLEGEVVLLRQRGCDGAEDPDDDCVRVVGYRLIDRPRTLVWLAALDAGAVHNDRLTEYRIGGDDAGASEWYQHLNLPWPLRDRHWMIDVGKTRTLTDATQGLIWEHHWALTDQGDSKASALLRSGRVPGLSGDDAERAIYLPRNRGAWTMWALNDNLTLVAVHTAAALGGWIPDAWVTAYTKRQLDRSLRDILARSDLMHESYDYSRPVYTGDGVMITPQMVVEAAQQ